MPAPTGTSGSIVVYFNAVATGFLSTAQKVSGSLATLASGLRQAGMHASVMGRNMLYMGTAMAVPLVKGTKDLIAFEKEFGLVTTMMDDANAGTVAELREGIKDLAKKFGLDLLDATKAVYFALSARIPADNVLDFVSVAAKSAVAGATDLETASKLLIGTVNSYSVALGENNTFSEKAAILSDYLFRIVQDGIITYDELSVSFGRLAPIASSAGVSMEEVGAAVAALTRNAIGPQNAITGLRQAFIGVLDPAAQAGQAFKNAGIDVEGFQQGTVSFTEILQQMADKLGLTSEKLDYARDRIKELPDEMLDAERGTTKFSEAVHIVAQTTGGVASELAKMFPNIRAFLAMMTLAKDGGEMFSNELSRMADSSGAADDAFNKMANTLSFKWNQLYSNFKVTYVDLFEVMKGKIEETFSKWNGWIDKVNETIKKHPEQVEATIEKYWGLTKTMLGLGAGVKMLESVSLTTAAILYIASAAAGVIGGPLTLAFAAVAGTIGALWYKTFLWGQEHQRVIDQAPELKKQLGEALDVINAKYKDAKIGVDDLLTKEEEAAIRRKALIDEVYDKLHNMPTWKLFDFSEMKEMGQALKDFETFTDAQILAYESAYADQAVLVEQKNKLSIKSADLAEENAQKEINALLRRSATQQEVDRIYMIALNGRVTKAQATVLMLNGITDSEILKLAVGTDEYRKAFIDRAIVEQGFSVVVSAETVKRLGFSEQETAKFVERMNEYLQANNMKVLNEQETTRALEVLKTTNLTVEQAAFVTREQLNDSEILMLQNGMNIRSVLHKSELENLIEKQEKEKISYDARVSQLTTFINKTREILESDKEKKAELITTMREFEYTNSTDSINQYTKYQNEYHEITQRINANQLTLHDAELERKRQEDAANGIFYERQTTYTQNQLQLEQQKINAQQQSAQATQYYVQVGEAAMFQLMNQDASLRTSFSQLTQEQKTQFLERIGAVVSWGDQNTDVHASAIELLQGFKKETKEAAQELNTQTKEMTKSTKNFGQETDVALTQGSTAYTGFLDNAITALNGVDSKLEETVKVKTPAALKENRGNYEDDSKKLLNDLAPKYQEFFGYIDPGQPHSPSLVQRVEWGIWQMQKLWYDYALWFRDLCIWFYDQMSYMDPTAYHSPSLVDKTRTGTEAIRNLWQTNVIDVIGNAVEAMSGFNPTAAFATGGVNIATRIPRTESYTTGGRRRASSSDSINMTFNIENVPSKEQLIKLMNDAQAAKERIRLRRRGV